MKEVHYFFVPQAATAVELPEEEATHAVRVLRMKSGDEIFLMDGQGTFYRAEVTFTTNKRCQYAIKNVLPQEPLWQGHLHLAIAPTKDMGRMEWMAEKATEVGIDEFTFLSCHFSERKVVKTERVERIVVSAMKQSRKPWKPVVNGMTPFKDFILQPQRGRKFICHCYDEIPKKDFFALLDNPTETQDVVVLVGPEGDFSIEEVRLAMEQGYESVTLGTARLRTETAGLAAVMMAQLKRRCC